MLYNKIIQQSLSYLTALIRRDKHFMLAHCGPLLHFILFEILVRVQDAKLWGEKNNQWFLKKYCKITIVMMRRK